MGDEVELLTDEEVEKIIVVFLNGNGKSTTDEITIAVEWARQARLDEVMLCLALAGKLGLALAENKTEIKFWVIEEEE